MDWGWKVLRIDILTRQDIFFWMGGFALQATMLEGARVFGATFFFVVLKTNFCTKEIGPVWNIEHLHLQHEGATPKLGPRP